MAQADLGYAATQDRYDPATGGFLGTTYLRADGSLQYRSTLALNPDGTTSYTYADGHFFDDKAYTAFTDTYDGGNLVTHAESNADGTRTVDVLAPDRTVASQAFDTFENGGQAGTTFVFTPGYGQDTVNGFVAAGAGHDVVSLPTSDFTSLADVLRHTHNVNGSAVITDPQTKETITLTGVSKAQLAHHPGDFAFHT